MAKAKPTPPPVHFVDFDARAEFERLVSWSLSLDSRNFVLDFDNASARCATDLDETSMGSVLERRAAERAQAGGVVRGTRWINIWRPEEQPRVIRRVGRHYGFSARLLASMCCPQATPGQSSGSDMDSRAHERRTVSEYLDDLIEPWRGYHHGRRRKPGPKQAGATARKISKDSLAPSEPERTANLAAAAVAGGFAGFDLNFYRLVNDVWHFSSIDWGRRFLCIGFNSLYRVDREIDVESYKPAGKRVWTWLVLCDDGTVVAIHENPFPGHREATITQHQARTVGAIRRNLRNIFCQLSRGFDDSRLQNMLETIKLRSNLPASGFVRRQSRQTTGLGGGDAGKTGNPGDPPTAAQDDTGDEQGEDDEDEDASPAVSESDAPSLLFYYLFDDWFTSYSLVARREHQYGVELDALRDRMFHRAELEHVSRLHHYGRQLAVLRRIYSSYATIIQRVLDGPQSHSSSSAVPTAAVMREAQALQDSMISDRSAVANYGAGNNSSMLGSRVVEIGEPVVPRNMTERGGGYGVEIAVAASTRFRRLRDRINMYAIGEIADCLEEKNSLMELNFNLITLKESSYIEGLTRITILLAKVTILFLPVSFVTAYFTVDFVDSKDGAPLQYNVRQYWITFMVVFLCTAFGLTLFGKLSGTQEGKPIYQSFTRVGLNGWQKFWRKLFGGKSGGSGVGGGGNSGRGGGGGIAGGMGNGIGNGVEMQAVDVVRRPNSIKLQALESQG